MQTKRKSVTLVTDEADFGAKKITKDKEVHYIIIKGSMSRRQKNHKWICT